ncbi:DUF4401 domain-containing protein [Sphingobacterium sp. SRCM116780]|uniref:DUF4401 domain-containing protein n=1 Tax=Sphingobacterium sp. SRCM116780 TaxID=2907623 RepID=UPI001F3C7301|nr:DUF4401 domain-containing protein [Sphingobacterium sp. SRCM116780]UIR55037.1 DUF4401 domain-containing protein [Sphingobacterium sp. SRCM116780]
MKTNEEIQHIIAEVSKARPTAIQINTEKIVEEYRFLSTNKSNIAIKVLSIVGVILSVFAFIAALYFLHLLDENINLLVFGFLLLTVSIFFIKKYNTIIIDTSSLALYALGGWMLIYGMDMDNTNLILIIVIAISIGTLLIVQRYLLSLFNILCILIGIIGLLIHNFENYLLLSIMAALVAIGLIYLLSNEATILAKRNLISTLYDSLRDAFTLTSIGITGYIISSSHHLFLNNSETNWKNALYLLSVAYGIGVLFMIYKIMHKLNVKKSVLMLSIYVLSILILAPTIINPGISGSILLLFICFYYQYKIGLSLAIIAFLYCLWRFYYDLNFSLLTKSIALMLSGVLFLIIYFVININKSSNEKI